MEGSGVPKTYHFGGGAGYSKSFLDERQEIRKMPF